MKTLNLVALSVILAACASKAPAPQAPAPTAAAPQHGLQIKLATVFVDDQDKALKFYTDVLGFTKKDDVSNGGYRWLTVTAPGDGNGGQLQLASTDNPAAKAYQQATFGASQPAIMLFTDDIAGESERIKKAGGELTMPVTEVMAGSKITMVKDTVGNLIQITQLAGH